MRIGSFWLAAACACGVFLSGAARAEPVVTLIARDGTTRVEGELMGFDGASYTLRTSLGTISVDAAQVTCEGAGCPGTATDADLPGGRFAAEGSRLIASGLMPALIEGYADSVGAQVVRQVGAEANRRSFLLRDGGGREMGAVDVVASGTAAAFSGLAEAAAAIGLASRRMTGAEGRLPDLRGKAGEHILALDGLVVLVHPDNPVRALTLDQIAALFAGRIGNWSQLGGPDRPVAIYLPEAGSGTLDLFEQMVMRPRRLSFGKSAERLADPAELSDLVAIDPGGLGLGGFAVARAARMLPIRQQCGLVSAPTRFSLKTEEYPLSRRLYAYETGLADQPLAKAVLDFALSDAAQGLIAEAGFADLGIEVQGIEVQGARLAHSLTSPEEFSLPDFKEMLGEIEEADRLSVTFRFTAGSTNLEARSQSEAEHFARLIAGGAYRGKDVLLIGFADSVGDFKVNRELALRRATAVLDSLKNAVPAGALDGQSLQTLSFGELTPVGCNDTPEGRELNRRVEVWVRDARK